MSEKIAGYILLVIGILIMLAGALSVYKVFTKEQAPIQLFNYPGISIDTSQMLSSSLPPELQSLVINPTQKKTGPAPKTELISSVMLNETANLTAHFILMGFFINLGYKLASLGVNLLRPVVVNYKVKENNPS